MVMTFLLTSIFLLMLLPVAAVAVVAGITFFEVMKERK